MIFCFNFYFMVLRCPHPLFCVTLRGLTPKDKKGIGKCILGQNKMRLDTPLSPKTKLDGGRGDLNFLT